MADEIKNQNGLNGYMNQNQNPIAVNASTPNENNNKGKQTVAPAQNKGQDPTKKPIEDEKKQEVEIKEFGFEDFKKAADRIIALPNVNNVLNKVKVKIDDNLLKDIFDHTQIGEKESLEEYAARCVHTATMFSYQNKFKRGTVDARTKAENASKNSGSKDEIDYESSTVMMDMIARGIKNFHVPGADEGNKLNSKGAYSATAIELIDMVKDQGVLLSRDADGNVRANQLNENEKAALTGRLVAINNAFVQIFDRAGFKIEDVAKVDKFEPAEKQPEQPVKDGETSKTGTEPEGVVKPIVDKSKVPSVPNQYEKVSPNGTKITYAEFKHVVDSIVKDEEIADAVRGTEYTVDQLASQAFNAGELLDGEDAALFAQRVLGTYLQKEIIENETGGVLTKKGKEISAKSQPLPTLEPDKRKEIGEGKDYENNPLFMDIKKLIQTTVEQIRTVITGKDEEERKSEYELVNHKGVPIELDDLSREKLTKKLNNFESAFNKAIHTYRTEYMEEVSKITLDEFKKVDRTKFSADDTIYQQKVDKLVENLDSMNLTDSNAVLTWMRDYSQTVNSMGSRPDVDVTKLEEAFKKAKIEMEPNAAEKYSNDLGDLGQATKWAVTIGAAQILTGDKVREDIVDQMCEIETEQILAQEKAKEAEGVQQPLPAKKVKWVKKLVDKTIEAKYTDQAGRDLVENVRRDLDPEYDKKRQEEENARLESQNRDEQEDEHSRGQNH